MIGRRLRRCLLLVLCSSLLLCAALEMCWASPALPATTQAEAVRELSRAGGFLHPVCVSVNPSDGSCWVADMGNQQIVHLAPDGITELSRAGGFCSPVSVSANPSDGSCWVADSYSNQVVHLAPDGITELSRAGGFNLPWSVSVNPSDGSCWVADGDNDRVVHLAPDGVTELSRSGYLSYPVSVSVNPGDGSCWATIRGWGWVVHLDSDGTTVLSRAEGFYGLESVSVNPGDGSCWVANSGDNQVVHLAPDGTTELSRAGGFSYPVRVSVDPADGSCWVADIYNNQVVHLAADGVTELSRTDGFYSPSSVSVNPSDGSCWVADTGNDQVVHLGLGSGCPVIQGVNICRGRFLWEPGAIEETHHESARITVHDWDGPEGLSVITLTPDGTSHPTPEDGGCTWDDGQYTLYQNWCRNPLAPLPTGAYTVIAQDPEGHIGSLLTSEASELPPMFAMVYPLDGEVIPEWDTQPVFSWEPALGADQVCVCVQTPGGEILWLKQGLPDTSASVQYNDDGSATLWELSPGSTYRVHVRAVYEEDQPSPNATVRGYVGRTTEFTLYSPVPKVTRFEVRRGRWAFPEGDISYQRWVKAFVTDMDGTEDVKSVTFTDSQDEVHDASFVCQWDETTAIYCWQSSREEDPSPPGIFTATVTDREGNSDSVSAHVSAVPEALGYLPAIESPPANYSVAPGEPTFAWSVPLGVGCYCLRMREVDGACAVWCPPGPMSSPATYDWSGLLAGHLHEWDLHSWMPDDIEQTDPRASSGFVFTSTGRFWVEPKFIGFLEPINNDGSSIFKLGSTVPVKFQLLNADGSYVSDATATLSIAKVEEQIVGTYQEAVSTAPPDSGNTFRYDPAANQYIFNLGTKKLSVGTWNLQVTVNGEAMKEVSISLK